eukprot:CAMPEP_0195107886 /NCGR_PEP_ID=MMETSP0448-20130528/82687_1 /TAXON_ID=66468 /ORGANISM="Heterocapsa triquestra, Strain CCMP 448" /LENGTH=163 /DNA_ID=CAMNT_0040144371 /DNA_START=1 /DNA_END=492 /DNA_ORIENTATION=-
MALKFYGISVPISIVLATAYFFWITREKGEAGGASKPGKANKQFKDIDVVVHKKPTTCGLKAGKDDILHLHYSGYLKSSGKQFESTRENSEPYVFKLGTCNEKGKPECLKGFQQGVTGMCAGEKRKVTVPANLAYGTKGRAPDIPPGDTIIYHLEMVDIDSFK